MQYTQDYKLALSKLCELRVQVLQHWLTAKQVGPRLLESVILRASTRRLGVLCNDCAVLL